jgi:hypothetical protein
MMWLTLCRQHGRVRFLLVERLLEALHHRIGIVRRTSWTSVSQSWDTMRSRARAATADDTTPSTATLGSYETSTHSRRMSASPHKTPEWTNFFNTAFSQVEHGRCCGGAGNSTSRGESSPCVRPGRPTKDSSHAEPTRPFVYSCRTNNMNSRCSCKYEPGSALARTQVGIGC